MNRFIVLGMRRSVLIFLLTVGLLAKPETSQATPALDFPSTETHSHGFAAGLTIGWGFTVNEPVFVDELGYYDLDQDGFVFDHEVGLFRASDMSLCPVPRSG